MSKLQEKKGKKKLGEKDIYQIKIILMEIKPPIWRRILVPGKISLGNLHDVIQGVMGWQECHLHQFIINDEYYTRLYDDLEYYNDEKDETSVFLKDVAPKANDSFVYEYDFGDSWEHLISVEGINPGKEKYPGHPLCLDGKRACPPEDCGGTWGYSELLEIIKDPKHEEYESMMEWLGGEFDPEYFNIDEVNNSLKRIYLPY